MRLRATAAAVALLASSLASAETSTAFKGQCDGDSIVRAVVVQNAKKVTSELPLSCNGVLLLEQDDGSAIISFLTTGETKGPMHSFASPGFAKATRARNLFISGTYRLDGRPEAKLQLTPTTGRCEFSDEPIKDSKWIRCFAQTTDLERTTTVRFSILAPGQVRVASEPAHQDKSYLIHNGSEIIATFDQGKMRMYYEKPKSALLAAGIHQGTLLFEGTAVDGRIKGTAFAFKAGCPPAPYPVQGVAHGDVGFELTGPGPQFGKRCAVLGLSWSSPHARLTFLSDNRSNE